MSFRIELAMAVTLSSPVISTHYCKS